MTLLLQVATANGTTGAGNSSNRSQVRVAAVHLPACLFYEISFGQDATIPDMLYNNFWKDSSCMTACIPHAYAHVHIMLHALA